MLPQAKKWTSWITSRSRRELALLIGGGLAIVVAATWGILTYRSHTQRAELLIYRLCIGAQQELCPQAATFVRDQGEDTAARWAQRECAGYRTRRIVITDAPQGCACQLADVTCASE